jgi:hypothetical protein
MRRMDKRILAVNKFAQAIEESGAKVTIRNGQSMLEQWNYNPEYNKYVPDEVELLVTEDMLFLIPKEEKMTKPIKVIIA